MLDSNCAAASRLSIQPEFGTAIVTHATCPFLVAHVAESEFFPHVDGRLELVVLNVIERESDPRQPIDPRQHLSEHLRVKAAVFLSSEAEQSVEPVAVRYGPEVDEVSSFSPPEQREELIDGQLLVGQQANAEAFLDSEQSGITSEVDFGLVAAAAHHQSGEPGMIDYPLDRQTVGEQCPLGSRNEPVDGDGARAEEVEIARPAVDVATG